MKKLKFNKKDVIHVPTKKEFDRIINILELDPEYMNWDVYEKETVIYPLMNQYGDINGYCKEKKFNIIESWKI
jgi:hypothetical protein